MTQDKTPIVTDSCVWINLAAALGGDLSQLRPSGLAVVVPQVLIEALFLHDQIGDDHISVGVNLSRIKMVTLDQGESELYVQFASNLDDGEAASLSVAHARSWLLGTDDKAAIRYAVATDPPTRVITTAQVLRRHAEVASWDAARITKAVQDVRDRASFVPPSADPEHEWWTAHL